MQREVGDEIGPHVEYSPEYTTAETVLDRIHESMLLFARGRSDALKRFLVDDGIGKDARFGNSPVALGPVSAGNRRAALGGWRLAQEGSGYDIPFAQHSTLVGDPRCTQEYRSRIFG